MDISARRARLRRVLAGTECASPASVYDPLSARLAEAAGFEVGLLGGSIASFVTLAAPDINLLTLTELSELARRITRASSISLVVDSDNGYGNALNAMRAVEEIEHAGASAVIIEDTELPVRKAGMRAPGLIPIAEIAGKLKAAVSARRDPSFVIVGRTDSLRTAGAAEAATRARAYAEAGVDAMLLVDVRSLDQVDAVRAATSLPLLIGHAPVPLDRRELAARGVRLFFQGHQPLAASIRAMRDTYAALRAGAAPESLGASLAPANEIEQLTRAMEFRSLQDGFLPSDD